ncbi:MAG TPA: phosphate signaling complex protein PhoU [Thermoanaerobaculaceae bacterium]|nr:phosphate signaling complex protein PhoU [Thermoanaerobaculaceae bacterium]
MASHLEAALQRDLEQIGSRVTEMGELTERAVRSAVRALAQRDRQLAYAVILRDQYIDAAEKELDRLCQEFLVRHQPAASLLRFAYATIKINLELERVGDYAESIAREALRLTKTAAPLPLDRLQQIVDVAVPMLHDAIQAFVKQDAELARRTIETDEAVDLLRDRLTADLTSGSRDGSLPFDAMMPLVAVARRLERVSDQARNISMETLYLCTGEYAKHPGSGAIRVLFVDERNACRSVMAEAIGNALAEAGFVFSSAGVAPAPVEPETVRFMAEKGFDVSRSVPHALSEFPNVEHQHVIVLLAPEARRAFPRRPRKSVLLDWTVEDPLAAGADEAAVAVAHERAFTFIEGQIHDLVSAIRDTGAM